MKEKPSIVNKAPSIGLSPRAAKHFNDGIIGLRKVIINFLKENELPPFIAKEAVKDIAEDPSMAGWFEKMTEHLKRN